MRHDPNVFNTLDLAKAFNRSQEQIRNWTRAGRLPKPDGLNRWNGWIWTAETLKKAGIALPDTAQR